MSQYSTSVAARAAMAVKWLFAGVAFAAAAGIAIGTAAIKADNVNRRRELELLHQEVMALEVTFEREKAAWRRAVEPRRLARMWARLDARGGE